MKDGFLLADSKLEVCHKKRVALAASKKKIKIHHEFDARSLIVI